VPSNLKTYDQIYPYLTPYAKVMLTRLKDIGIEDRDLRMTILETIFNDNSLYELPEVDDE